MIARRKLHSRARGSKSRGFTGLELVFATIISAGILIIVVSLLKDAVTLNSVFQGTFTAQQDTRKLLKTMTAEMRTITYAETGSYPIAAAGAQSFTFYTDVDSDGVIDRVRYYLSGTTIKKGVIVPTGSPLAYTGAETVTTVLSSVANGSANVFDYYDATYTGTSSALSQPVNTNDVRLVKITLTLDPNGGKPTGPQTFSVQVMLRNLKDNL